MTKPTRAHIGGAALLTVLRPHGNSTPTVSVAPTANASQTIGVDPGYVAGEWSSGTPIFDRWESSADGSTWATAAAMPDADSPPTDAEFGKVLRVIEVNGSTEAASAATGAVNTAGNMVLTPFFLTDTNWTKGTNWTISGGKANAAAAPSGGTGNLTQNISLVADTSYSIRFTISDYSAGTIRILCGNVTPGTSRSSNGTFTQTLVRNAAGDGVLYFQVTAEFTGKIDNVSVVPN
jgi:hypothetical protein